MNAPRVLTALLLISLSGCSTQVRIIPRDPVLVIYHVKPGSEKKLESVLRRTWNIYRKEGMVFSQPHICIQAHEDNGRDRFIEIFEWRGYYATEYPPESVKAQWREMRALCEPRGGQLAIEFRDVEMFTPRVKEAGK